MFMLPGVVILGAVYEELYSLWQRDTVCLYDIWNEALRKGRFSF